MSSLSCIAWSRALQGQMPMSGLRTMPGPLVWIK